MKIIICDDQAIVREGLAMLLKLDREIESALGGFSRGLHLSEGTVQNYISSILAKLDVSGRTQAAVMAIRQ